MTKVMTKLKPLVIPLILLILAIVVVCNIASNAIQNFRKEYTPFHEMSRAKPIDTSSIYVKIDKAKIERYLKRNFDADEIPEVSSIILNTSSSGVLYCTDNTYATYGGVYRRVIEQQEAILFITKGGSIFSMMTDLDKTCKMVIDVSVK